MKSRRIHITGASGAGVTTLGRALADHLALPHHDTDDYYWKPTEPPYRHKRASGDRVRLMHEVFVPRAGWILSGSLDGWGDVLVPHFDLVVFLKTPSELRVERLRAREAMRFGADSISPGGWRFEEAAAFFDWASHYEHGTREGRSLARHEAWLANLPCPVLRLNGSRPVAELVGEVLKMLQT
jgi:adenylate kinase family enzyme